MVRWLGFFFLLLVLFISNLAKAETWFVEKDGSGDFTVIQEAVDAASDGDVIEIGPGRFDDFQLFFGDDVIYVAIDNKSLTLNGSGIGQTIIGPEEIEDNFGYSYCIYKWGGSNSLTVQNISFENANDQTIVLLDGTSQFSQCSFSANKGTISRPKGFVLVGESDSHINECTFSGLDDAIMVNTSCWGVVIENSQFISNGTGVSCDWASAVGTLVQNCIFVGSALREKIGVLFNNGATGTVRGCHFSNLARTGVGSTFGGSVEVYDNVFDQTSGAGVLIYGCDGWYIHDNIIQSESKCIWFWYPNENPNGLVVQNNHLFRGSQGHYVFFDEEAAWGFDPPIHIDFSNNYWGTQDVEEISQWIQDGYDYPEMGVYIDFLPLADGPVSTERMTLDGVKALYR